ncbi:hypothetical protein KC19_2G016800 [Ceratodon purpureus]|uniref:Uncharacterized protein n=1 Tax=Ceratodon purpureus TaxID=3225 RepID=A0A8T0IP10_CERPU|nr:hypothetical protein KC19_2G016800 [Ceratodon purpureus]
MFAIAGSPTRSTGTLVNKFLMRRLPRAITQPNHHTDLPSTKASKAQAHRSARSGRRILRHQGSARHERRRVQRSHGSSLSAKALPVSVPP